MRNGRMMDGTDEDGLLLFPKGILFGLALGLGMGGLLGKPNCFIASLIFFGVYGLIFILVRLFPRK